MGTPGPCGTAFPVKQRPLPRGPWCGDELVQSALLSLRFTPGTADTAPRPGSRWTAGVGRRSLPGRPVRRAAAPRGRSGSAARGSAEIETWTVAARPPLVSESTPGLRECGPPERRQPRPLSPSPTIPTLPTPSVDRAHPRTGALAHPRWQRGALRSSSRRQIRDSHRRRSRTGLSLPSYPGSPRQPAIRAGQRRRSLGSTAPSAPAVRPRAARTRGSRSRFGPEATNGDVSSSANALTDVARLGRNARRGIERGNLLEYPAHCGGRRLS